MPCTIRTVVATLALALAATAAPARATIAPNARTVVEHYVAAAGGRAAFDSVRTVRTVARIQALGMAGTTVTYAARPDRRASVTNLGPFRIPEGIDGQQGWRADPGGKILVLDGKDLIDARASAWFENQMWTTAGEGGGQVRVSGADKDANGTYTILEVTPPVGDPRRYWFDDRTHLVVRESMRHDQNEVTGEMSDWRDAGGRKFPFHAVERISGMPANDLTIDIDSVIVNGPVDPAVFRRPDADSDTTSGAMTMIHSGGSDAWDPVPSGEDPTVHGITNDGTNLIVAGYGYVWYLGLDGSLKLVAGTGYDIDNFPSGYDAHASHPALELALPASLGSADEYGTGSIHHVTYHDGAVYFRGHADGTAAFVEKIACP